MIIKFHLDSLKEEEETPEKKIYFVSPFVGSVHGDAIPTRLLKAYTYHTHILIFQFLTVVKISIAHQSFVFHFFVKLGKAIIQLLKDLPYPNYFIPAKTNRYTVSPELLGIVPVSFHTTEVL